MKRIRVDGDNFLVELTRSELLNMHGYLEDGVVDSLKGNKEIIELTCGLFKVLYPTFEEWEKRGK